MGRILIITRDSALKQSNKIDTMGRLEGMGVNVPNPGVDRVYFSGSASPDTIAIDYLVVFSGGSGTAEGILNMVR